MFDNDFFDNWLDKKSKELVEKIGKGESLTSEEMIILVLKAQTNHFYHLDSDLRTDMQMIRTDIDKRFDQVDTKFDEADKKFESMQQQLERFMFWSLGLSITSTFFILGFIKFVG